jgi:hypothetical protein
MRDARGRFTARLGMYLDDKGYWRYSAGEHRNRRVHRVRMEQHLGRPLRKDEHVHHRDGNKQNNDLHADGKWNLELMDERTHNAVSAKQYWFLKTNIWPNEREQWDAYFARP